MNDQPQLNQTESGFFAIAEQDTTFQIKFKTKQLQTRHAIQIRNQTIQNSTDQLSATTWHMKIASMLGEVHTKTMVSTQKLLQK